MAVSTFLQTALVVEVYRITTSWPSEEKFGLTSQVRSAVVSIASNIAEGQGRGSQAQFRNFLSIAHGSLREVEAYLMISERLGYLTSQQTAQAFALSQEVGRLIQGLLRHLKASSQ